MANIVISTEDFVKIVEDSFNKGKLWGETYSGWFIPTDEQNKAKINDAKTKALKKCKVPQYIINGYVK